MRSAALVVCALAAGCDSGYSVQIDVERACLMVSAAEIDITVTAMPSGAVAMQTVKSPDSTFPSHRIVIVPPEGVSSLSVSAVARDALGGTIGSGSVSVTVAGHQLAMATLTITGPACSDGGSDGGCHGDGGCPCATDLECSGATPRCDPMSNRCVPCLPTDDNCPFGQICHQVNGVYGCGMGCKTDVDCAAVDAGAGSFKCCGKICVDVTSDPANCAMCGHACAGTEGCCGAICHDVTADASNCGMCGHVCSLPNAMAICVARQCAVGGCNGNFHDCDNSDPDGCESNPATDPANCGGCGMPCSNNHATPHCTGAFCDSMCTQGYLDCNGDLRGDGCEVDPATDADNCGGCAMACPMLHVPVPTCGNGMCNGVCEVGWSDCNNNKRSDGCEINTANDPMHCGTCNTVCGSGVCVGGDCVRRIFVTSTVYTGGAIGGVAGADTICQTLATAALLTGNYKAWLSDMQTHATNRVSHPLAGYQLVNGTRVANSYNGFISGALLHPINLNEKGVAAALATGNCVTPMTPFAWTNTTPKGLRNGMSCQNWSSALNTDDGAGGSPLAMDATWTNLGCASTCDLNGSLYCLEQ
jgi:hypothetical protein